MATPVRRSPGVPNPQTEMQSRFRALCSLFPDQREAREVGEYFGVIGDAVQCARLGEVAEGYRMLDRALAQVQASPELPELVSAYQRAMVLYVEEYWPRFPDRAVVNPVDLEPPGPELEG